MSIKRTGPGSFRATGAAAVPFIILWIAFMAYWLYVAYRILVTVKAWPFA